MRQSDASSYRMPISCVDSSVQARVVMEQISRERSQKYKDSVVQTVLGQHDGHRKPSDAKPKVKFPNIDERNPATEKNPATSRQINNSTSCEREETFTKMETFPCHASGPSVTSHFEPLSTDRRPGSSNRISYNSALYSTSASSSAVGRMPVGKHHPMQRRPRAAVHKNGAVLRAQPIPDRSHSEGLSRMESCNDNPRRREIRRRYTPDTTLPRRARSQSSGRSITDPPLPQTRKRRGSNLDAGRSQSDQDISGIEAQLKTKPRQRQKTRHMWQSHDGIPQAADSQDPMSPSLSNLGPSDWQLAREKSFEITFPGYDTRFVDLPDRNALYQESDMSDIDRQIESQIHASSIEKCRRWLNKWVLTT
ncbi:uncharacterized protein LOC110985567 isoform X2 [Acanthaster planci]|nr:uncharacterized protein LOC110985567 isoform X2 [Acanthaster planci]